MPQSLGQVIALESAARADANKRLGMLHKSAQKPALFNGFDKTYTPFSETDDEARSGIKRLPPEGNSVQLRAEGVLGAFLEEMGAAVNLAHAKDAANCTAKADVVVDGNALLRDVPATHLLHMEKVLADLGTFVAALPVEDPTEQWAGHADGLKRTEETFTVRNVVKKVPLVLHPPTDKHAAQVAAIDETIPEGRWTTVKYTGALSPDRKRELERRVAALKDAFKTAREAANRVEVPNSRTDEAAVLSGYILG
jgi:hypothetical protein